MARTSVLGAVDKLIPGGIQAWVDEGLSTQEIRDRIRDQHGIEVSPTSVYRYLRVHGLRAAS